MQYCLGLSENPTIRFLPERIVDQSKTQILVVDDHPLIRRGLISSIEENTQWSVCGEAVDGREAIKEFIRLQPDLILMDISMPLMNGVEATRHIHQISPSTKIVILSMHDSPQVRDEASRAGANAYVTQSAGTKELRQAIWKVLEDV